MKRVIKASTEADLYVVQIIYEIEGMRSGNPDAAEEIMFIPANSEEEAIEKAKKKWDGPIDFIEVVDVNPDMNNQESVPFE